MHSIFPRLLFSSVFIILFFLSTFGSEPAVVASSSSDTEILNNAFSAIAKTDDPTVINTSVFIIEQSDESEKILVVLLDSYGSQNYSKVVITDVDMELSILIAKDVFNKLPGGIYTIIASSANDLISQKLIIE